MSQGTTTATPRACSVSRVSERLAGWRGGAWVAGGVPVNTVLLGTRTIVRGLVALAMLPLLVSRLGAAPTGLFVFATTLTGYFTTVEYGVGMSVTKYVAEHRATGEAELLGSILRASLLLLLGLATIVALVVAALALLAGQALFGGPSVRSQAVPTLLVAAGVAFLYWPSRIGPAALRGLERYDICAIVEMSCAVLTLVLIFLVGGVTHSVAILTGVFGAVFVLEGVSAGVVAWPHLGLRRGVGRWRGAHLRPAMGFSAGMFLIGLSDTLIYESDRIVVTAFVGAAALVVYEVALRPQTGIRLIAGLVGSALISTSSRLVAQDRTTRLRELVLVGSLYQAVLTVPFVVLTFMLAQPIVEAWMGHGYGRYASYVQIFISYWFFGANTGVLSSAIWGSGRIRVFVWLTVLGAVLTLALSIALAAAWGTVGVIWGTVIPAWIGLPVWMHFALRHIGISKARFAREVLVPGYLPIAAWAVPVVVLAQALDPHSLLGLGAFCAIALAALWLALLPLLRERWRTMFDEGLTGSGRLSVRAPPDPAPGR
jgi:O-antigen/teichoic acid export membrane protein